MAKENNNFRPDYIDWAEIEDLESNNPNDMMLVLLEDFIGVKFDDMHYQICKKAIESNIDILNEDG